MPVMAEENFQLNHRAPYKTRSSSISAPSSSSLETFVCQPVDNGNNTTDYRPRKPATRSQSARITSARTVRESITNCNLTQCHLLQIII